MRIDMGVMEERMNVWMKRWVIERRGWGGGIW